MLSSKLKLFLIVFGLVLVVSDWTHAQSISGQISRIGDATHLEFSGRNEWIYDDPVKNGNKLTLSLPAFDQVTETRLRTWACPFIKEVLIDKNGPDQKFSLTFVLTDEAVESFNYQTDDPNRLIFDFYKKSTNSESSTASVESAAQPQKAPTKASLEKKSPRSEYTKVTESKRNPASSEILTSEALAATAEVKNNQPGTGVFDGSDPNYDRFLMKDYEIKEEAIIASQQNIYIKFPMLKMKVDRFAELMQKPPIYEIKPTEQRENKEARFIIKMFQEKKWGSFSETHSYFMKKYPNTQYDEIMRNMYAEQKIWEYLEKNDYKAYEQFRSEYQYLLQKYPDSILSERHLLLLGHSALHRKDGAEALQQFQRYIAKYPKSSENDRVLFGIADAYSILFKPEDAIVTYSQIEGASQNPSSVAEAAYRKGDIYFGQNDFKKSAATYQAAIKKFPAWQGVLPNAQYNLSESLFWQGQYQQSLNEFVEYLKKYPAHEHGGFAMARIGELLQILGADQSRVTGAFIEGYFRFPQSQGSEISRIRMLSQAFRGMKEKEKQKAQKEIEEISSQSTLPRMSEFATLTIAEGLSRRAEYESSLKKLVDYYQAHPTTASQSIFKGRIVRNISDVMKKEVDANQFMAALAINSKYANTWLKNGDRIDIPYYRALALEKSGVYNESKKIYSDLIKKLNSMSGRVEEKKRKIYENLPSQNQLHLRLAAVSLQEKQYQSALTYLKDIKGPLQEKEEIEKAQIGSQVALLVGEYDQAIGFFKQLIDSFKGQDQMLAQPYLSLAQLYLKKDQVSESENYIQKLEKLKELKKISGDVWADGLLVKSDLLLKKGQKVAAVETLNTLLDEFETERPLSSVRFKAGQILFDDGDVKGAEKIWSRFDPEKDLFYKKLAQEKVRQAEWVDSYKKYIDRIPAAEDLK